MRASIMKQRLTALLGVDVVRHVRKFKRRLMHLRNSGRSLQQIFSDVYRNHNWGGDADDFSSGSGSDDALALRYTKEVQRFANENSVRSIVDLGCGDFRVGAGLDLQAVKYIGIDVVPQLIARNQSKYATENVTFKFLDAVRDKLPKADLCLIRQVFQHLANDQIYQILNKLDQYRWVLVTEHYPSSVADRITPNRDKPAGYDTRLLDNSAVFLDLPPFELDGQRLLFDVEVPDWLVMPGERLKTFVFEHPRPKLIRESRTVARRK
jgi:SAM-dependent methyltransferase